MFDVSITTDKCTECFLKEKQHKKQQILIMYQQCEIKLIYMQCDISIACQ